MHTTLSTTPRYATKPTNQMDPFTSPHLTSQPGSTHTYMHARRSRCRPLNRTTYSTYTVTVKYTPRYGPQPDGDWVWTGMVRAGEPSTCGDEWMSDCVASWVCCVVLCCAGLDCGTTAQMTKLSVMPIDRLSCTHLLNLCATGLRILLLERVLCSMYDDPSFVPTRDYKLAKKNNDTESTETQYIFWAFPLASISYCFVSFPPTTCSVH